MILVDTSVWADHIRQKNDRMSTLLKDGQILIHPYVVGELALGNLHNRAVYLASFESFPPAIIARDDEFMAMIDAHQLHGTGIAYIDAHLLASSRLSFAKLWTNNKRLQLVAERFGLAS
jgi:predicted nucleic acid-binding protein